jgi:hypothetical protein
VTVWGSTRVQTRAATQTPTTSASGSGTADCSLLARRLAKGERSGKIPYGLALAEDGRHLVEDGFEQSVIARVKALRAEGHAVTRIAKALDALGVSTRSGRPWHPQQVADARS